MAPNSKPAVTDAHHKGLGFGTTLLHADDDHSVSNVTPAISVSTTFRNVESFLESDLDPADPAFHVYSRYTTPNSVRVEKVLSQILNGYALTYASGLAAATAALAHYNPRRIAITKGYMGSARAIAIYQRSKPDLQLVGIDDEYEEGDLVWIETPLNPTGEVRNLKHYASKAHAVGAHVLVDATFGPPPLQDPFLHGADCVFHSGTKYLGGHSDLLAGVLVVKNLDKWHELFHDRTYLGNVMGSLESWLLLRSLRTLHVRVPRQSETGTKIAQWLQGAALAPAGQSFEGVPSGLVVRVGHASVQGEGGVPSGDFDVKAQMPGGFSPCFSIWLSDSEQAKRLPHLVKVFTAATSLGGVESLMEHRASIDPNEDPRLVRLSVGLEDFEDLKEDLRRALVSLSSSAEAKL